MKNFLNRLFQNPSFAGHPPTVVEALVISFIDKNSAGLIPLFQDPAYFPGKSWEEVRALLLQELRSMVSEQVLPAFKEEIKKIDFASLNLFQGESLTSEVYESAIVTFIEKIIVQQDVRIQVDNLNRLLKTRTLYTYVTTAVENRSYLYNELFKVDRINFSPEQYIDILNIVLLLSPAVHIRVPRDMEDFNRGTISYSQAKSSSGELKIFCTNLKLLLESSLPNIPEKVLDIIVDSLKDASEDKSLMASSRFIAILNSRGKDLRLNQKVDKGADTPDKSWFSVAMRNARFLGLDKRMLEDLNRLAFELRR